VSLGNFRVLLLLCLLFVVNRSNEAGSNGNGLALHIVCRCYYCFGFRRFYREWKVAYEGTKVRNHNKAVIESIFLGNRGKALRNSRLSLVEL